MKKLFLLLTTLITITTFAQKTFDSASYIQFYQKRWEMLSYNEMMSEKGMKELTTEEKIAGLTKAVWLLHLPPQSQTYG